MKVLIIGLGSIAKKHINAIRAQDNSIQIFALRSKANSEDIDYVTNIYSIDELEMDGIDFILISNPTAKHFSTIQQLSKYNKPLFIEKPLFSEINKKSDSLVNEIENKKMLTYVACNLRFLNCIQELKRLLYNKRINEVNVYCGSYLPDWRPGVDFKAIYSANKEMGGGVHIDLIHELDYIYWLFGEPKKTQSFFSNISSLDISAYDYANYLWRYPDFSASIILNYYRKDSKRTIEVVADTGTYFVNLLENKIWHNKRLIFKSDQKIIDTYFDQMQFFIKNIINKKEKFNTIAEANIVLKLCMQD
ncbi:Gfo/Idh/MocA family protein [Elizabethkingia meningoseptica]